MKINTLAFGAALAIVAAVLWLLCSAFVAMVPGPMMNMSGHMLHTDLSSMGWTLNFGGVIVGLIAWTVFAFIFGSFAAWVYNLIVRS